VAKRKNNEREELGIRRTTDLEHGFAFDGGESNRSRIGAVRTMIWHHTWICRARRNAVPMTSCTREAIY
jgi:hypothetical protein